MPFCQTSKANIYFEIIGSGIPIIMLHGFSPDHRLMKGCMEPIFLEQEGWKRIYFDLPGMGKTTNYSSIQNSDEMLEVVNEFIQTLIPDESYLLVGESYGGYLARGIMRKSAVRLLGAAFICPLILPEKDKLMTIKPLIPMQKQETKKDLIKRRKIFLRGRKSQKKFVQKRNVRGGKSF